VNPDPFPLNHLAPRLYRAAQLGRSHGTSLGARAARAAVDCLGTLFADEDAFLVFGVIVSLTTLSVLIALLMMVSSAVVANLSWLLAQLGPIPTSILLMLLLTLLRRFSWRPQPSSPAGERERLS
jgi:hypothetical protein